MYKKNKGKHDLDHTFYFQHYVKLPMFKSFCPFFNTFLTDRQTNILKKVSKEIIRAYPTLLMFFVSSSMLKSLCLRLFDIHAPNYLINGIQDSCSCLRLLCSHCLNINVLLYMVLNRSSMESFD